MRVYLLHENPAWIGELVEAIGARGMECIQWRLDDESSLPDLTWDPPWSPEKMSDDAKFILGFGY